MSAGDADRASAGSEDTELELLKARRLAEMRKNISLHADAPAGQEGQTEDRLKNPGPRELLVGLLGYRGEEVLRNAEAQFPYQTRMVVQEVGDLILSGSITEQIDGGMLLSLFRSVGINVRMDTKIHVEKDGKMVSISDKLGMGKRADDKQDDTV